MSTKTKEQRRQEQKDRERYDAAMRAKREHEAKFGPIRPIEPQTPDGETED
jgi:hypothetical protein